MTPSALRYRSCINKLESPVFFCFFSPRKQTQRGVRYNYVFFIIIRGKDLSGPIAINNKYKNAPLRQSEHTEAYGMRADLLFC